MKLIRAERNSPSDDWLLILQIVVEKNQFVRSGDVLVEIEGAKAVFSFESVESGYIWPLVSDGQQVQVGSVLFVLSDEPFIGEPYIEDLNPKNSSNSEIDTLESTIFTKSAENLLKSGSLDRNLFSGFKLVTEADVQNILDRRLRTATLDFSRLKGLEGIVSLGAGRGLSQLREVCDSNSIPIVGSLDDSDVASAEIQIPIIGKLNQSAIELVLNELPNTKFMLSISSNLKFRKKIIGILDAVSAPIATAVHSRSSIGSFAEISEGTLIMDSARVGTRAILGRHVFLSAFVDIEHHCNIGENCTFGPGVQLSGGVSIGNDCVFGSGIVVEPGVQIGSNCIIASGAIITTDLPDNTIVKVRSGEIKRSRAGIH